MADSNRQLQIAELPTDKLSAEHFRMVEAPIPTPGEGEVLARTLLLSLDPANRAWMQGATYRSALNAGQVMAGFTLGRVIESNDPEFAAGDLVEGDGGWQDYFCLAGKRLNKRAPREPLTHLMSVLGVTGNTAYYGMAGIGKPKAGETILVSAAGGATGSVAGQIAKRAGARVVGVAGGPDKCARVVAELGFDECLDYRGANLFQALKEVCPDGIDVYFDNVGGTTLEAALFRMNLHGRIICCGVVSQYDTATPAPGPRGVPGLLVTKRLTMQGFLVGDDPALIEEGQANLSAWVDDGSITVAEDVVEGLENAPAGLVGLLAGENFGKRMIKVSD
ncbi:MAG: NADP-dependent oxidoreductase [Gammaproteobacteria bacterium]|nr:MAG: NADP-dependent oxidoreductase [Gammaproteobacteria bacterium]TDJ41125.1 MAG: NADP-dependent oxidoreductase [Gammaproteobacteria bacterium]